MMADTDDLDDLLAKAAATRAAPSAALMTRILADADAGQPRPALRRPANPASRGWIGALADWFGGGLSLAGMSAAAATGLFLGVAQPASVVALAELVTGTATIDRIDLLPASGTLWAQE
jgi:hypothetical protein